ncbi:signal transduction histidine-protein kinase BarA [Geobacter sp. OR-1]|uniref:ATP-binding response regulator n=1 Tax=Geobacter sp. OR-1 TaxID=1266765 RepID=UPI000544207E|nr:ATP-binding protein [Geobacter sp. OR-1]GAM11155.1 signal transduction histidine-protein kinase BarA [Geobacter sp. OR-1]
MQYKEPGHEITILLIDDDANLLGIIPQYLRKMLPCDITSCNDPLLALDEISRSRYDIIISDYLMPNMTGVEILNVSRKLAPETPFIIMTGQADLDTAMLSIKNGAFDFVVKPLDFDLLANSIKKALAFTRGAALEREYKKQLEEEVFKKTAELRNALYELEVARNAAHSASIAKSAFMSAISHELRTPLNGIVGSISLLKDHQLDPEQQELLNAAEQSAQRLNSIVDNILAYVEVKSDSHGKICRKFSPREVISSIMHPFAGKASQKGLDFRIVYADPMPDILYGDDLSLGQTLEIIVDNAIKFTHIGAVEVKITPLRKGDSCLGLAVAVKDTGIGIPEEKLDVIFDEFRQGDCSLTRLYEGVGIGLPLAKKLVELLGGSLDFETEPGKGSEFNFAIPFKTELQ